jgi:hypothetical protein
VKSVTQQKCCVPRGPTSQYSRTLTKRSWLEALMAVLTHESAECEYVRREEEAEKYFVAK